MNNEIFDIYSEMPKVNSLENSYAFIICVFFQVNLIIFKWFGNENCEHSLN